MKKLTERERLIEQVWLRSIQYNISHTQSGAHGAAWSMAYSHAESIADQFIAEREASARVKRSRTKWEAIR